MNKFVLAYVYRVLWWMQGASLSYGYKNVWYWRVDYYVVDFDEDISSCMFSLLQLLNGYTNINIKVSELFKSLRQ